MSDPDLQRRFEELDAARALGDLSPEEHGELARLIANEGFETDSDFDWIVAALDVDQADSSQSIDAQLKQKLLSDAENFGGGSSPSTIVQIWRHPALGWAAAACIALAFVMLKNPDQPTTAEVVLPTPEEQVETLIQNAAAVLPFSGTPGFPELSGDVVWGDEQQEGYMRLVGLPANDPTKSQYQLWIVDPERDDKPVDGGVFDIPAGGGSILVPINAALAVAEPAAFVITVEKPGGVVVSNQEVVAAIAKRAS